MLENDGIKDKIAVFLASGGWVGYSPFAPGTIGSMMGMALFVPLSWLPAPGQAVAIAVAVLLSFQIAGSAERIFGKKDCGTIVIDEVIGVFFTMYLIPISFASVLMGFLLFRIFDIAKPFPARWADSKVKGGVGVVLDDIIAGIYANIAVRLLLPLWMR